MRLFKKLFSIRSRKPKKRLAVDACTESPAQVQEHLKPCDDEGAEAALCRLLRSSSGRCAQESQTSFGSLPPLAHPIDSVVAYPKPTSATIPSVSARSTYSVTIHSRTVHSRTEFPNAYPPMDKTCTPKYSFMDSPRRRSKSVPITPRDKNRLQLLRQDPSVANLLDYYNDEGHLNSALFSNTPSPQKDGCVQRRRTGSTLRQLLGRPSSSGLRDSTEGDISWAERFLGETDGNSSVSSIGPRTPIDTHFTYTHSINDKTALPIECDTSAANHPTFSSLEVELSLSTDHTHLSLNPNGSSMTSQRASQIFGFLGDKKRAPDSPVSRLPHLKTATPTFRRFSAESSLSDTRHSQIPLPRRSNTYTFQPISPTSPRCFSPASDTSKLPSPTTAVFSPPQLEDEISMVSQAVISEQTGQGSRGLYGPRPPPRIPSRQSTRPLSVLRDHDEPRPAMEQPVCTRSISGVADSRSREMHSSQIPKLRSASGSSNGSVEAKRDFTITSPHRHPAALQPAVQKKFRPAEVEPLSDNALSGKEIDILCRLPQPVTPIRPFGYHAHHLREPPSPASLSEMSPVAKQMTNLRQQRIHARRQERQSGRLGSSHTKIRC